MHIKPRNHQVCMCLYYEMRLMGLSLKITLIGIFFLQIKQKLLQNNHSGTRHSLLLGNTAQHRENGTALLGNCAELATASSGTANSQHSRLPPVA